MAIDPDSDPMAVLDQLFAPATRGLRAGIATADQLATWAGTATLVRGGNAVDAAIAANAALAVTAPHLCGIGGDLFALVHTGRSVIALNASGRAGSGADPEPLRAAGLSRPPLRHHIAAVTVPGCVDGWIALHDRLGSMDLDTVFAPAVELAEDGFSASGLLVGSLLLLDDHAKPGFAELIRQALRPGAPVRRPGMARTLRSIAATGRDGFYHGEFGQGLLAIGAGWFDEEDLGRNQAEWADPLVAEAFGHELHTTGPNSQGYLTLGAARLVERLGIPADPTDPDWAHLLIEATTAAGHDRPQVLHEHADGHQLLDRIDHRIDIIGRDHRSARPMPVAGGDTTALCVRDHHGLVVSLIQSNASGFGSWLVEPATGINLHDRGIGFTLEPGHPAELRPGARPPHTLSPLMITRDGEFVAAAATMGGDAQPQILLQVLTRMLAHGARAQDAIRAPRWVLTGRDDFSVWSAEPTVLLETGAPAHWAEGLAARGHEIQWRGSGDPAFGHAHAILDDASGSFAVAADPRARVGGAAAW